MNSISFFLSLLLHMSLVLLILLWPSAPPKMPPREAYQVSLVMGAPGGENLPSPVLGARALVAEKPNASLAPPVPAVKPEEAPQGVAEAPAPDVPAATPQASQAPAPSSVPPEPAPLPPSPREAALPQIPKPEVVEEKKQPLDPEKKPEVVKKPEEKKLEAVKKPEEKKVEPEKKPEEKKVEPDKKPEDKKPEEKKPAEKKPEEKKPEKPRDVLADALGAAQKEAGKTPAGQGSTQGGGARRSSAANALADLQKQVGVGGGGGQGDGPGGGGIYDVYTGLIMRMVQPNWSTAIYSRENITVQLRIVIDLQGNVLECTVARSSGRPEFDASAQNAVMRTAVLPPPPSPEYQNVLINFNSQDAAGR